MTLERFRIGRVPGGRRALFEPTPRSPAEPDGSAISTIRIQRFRKQRGPTTRGDLPLQTYDLGFDICDVDRFGNFIQGSSNLHFLSAIRAPNPRRRPSSVIEGSNQLVCARSQRSASRDERATLRSQRKRHKGVENRLGKAMIEVAKPSVKVKAIGSGASHKPSRAACDPR